MQQYKVLFNWMRSHKIGCMIFKPFTISHNSRNSNIKTTGFTLIELLVAIAIFAIISIISYRTLSSLITTKETMSRV